MRGLRIETRADDWSDIPNRAETVTKMNFASDNVYGAMPEILAAIVDANTGAAASYGNDDFTAALQPRLAEVFEREVSVFPVLTGTAANALALATLAPPYGAIFCHEESHIAVDECGAPEFFSGGARLVSLQGHHGKITPEAVMAALPLYSRGVHSPKPSVISIAQATESGTVYSAAEVSALSTLAHAEDMRLHMDGARFANAVASLECRPAEITWKSGVDVLSFGASKNGALCAEAVIFFDAGLVGDFEYRRKRSGHLISKARFVSAQLLAYVENDRWLEWGRRSNALARKLAQELLTAPGVHLAQPVEANEVFARMPNSRIEALRAAGVHFYEWGEANGQTTARFVISPSTPEEHVTRLIQLMRS